MTSHHLKISSSDSNEIIFFKFLILNSKVLSLNSFFSNLPNSKSFLAKTLTLKRQEIVDRLEPGGTILLDYTTHMSA